MDLQHRRLIQLSQIPVRRCSAAATAGSGVLFFVWLSEKDSILVHTKVSFSG